MASSHEASVTGYTIFACLQKAAESAKHDDAAGTAVNQCPIRSFKDDPTSPDGLGKSSPNLTANACQHVEVFYTALFLCRFRMASSLEKAPVPTSTLG